MTWENLCLFLVTCCMTVQSAIFYITKIIDSATFVYTVYFFGLVWFGIRLIIYTYTNMNIQINHTLKQTIIMQLYSVHFPQC